MIWLRGASSESRDVWRIMDPYDNITTRLFCPSLSFVTYHTIGVCVVGGNSSYSRTRVCPVFCTHTRARARVRVFLMEHKDPGLDRSFDADRVDRMRSLSRELRNEISFHSVDDSLVLG